MSVNGDPNSFGRRPRGPDDNKERAFIAAARRKDRSPEGKIESAKKSSEAHYETHGRYFYLTLAIILDDKAFEDLEDLDQLDDPALILPDGADKTFIRAEILHEKASQGLFPRNQPVVSLSDAQVYASMNGGYGAGTGGGVVVFPGQLTLQRGEGGLSRGGEEGMTTQGSSEGTTQVDTSRDTSPEERTMLDFLKDPDEVEPDEDVAQEDLPDEEHVDVVDNFEDDSLFDLGDATLVNGWIDEYTLGDLSYDSQHMFCNGQEDPQDH